jgi:hypothetical protein
MTLKEFIKTDLASINKDLGNPFITFNGEDYACIPSSVSTAGKLEWGGIAEDSDLVVTINKDLFTDGIYPNSKRDYITYNDIQYRVNVVKTDATGAILRLFCTDTQRGV